MDKNKKKTLTISSNFKKKIDTSTISRDGKKTYSIEKKKPFRESKNFNKSTTTNNLNKNDFSKKEVS